MKIEFPNKINVNSGISERADGTMAWNNTKPISAEVLANREQFFKKEGIDSSRVVSGGIAHGVQVSVVGQNQVGEYILDSDALVTNVENLYLSITAADCMPVYFYDPVKNCIGIAHAGRKGLAAGILENVVSTLVKEYGSIASDVQVIIGPHIRPCHYDITEEQSKLYDPKNLESGYGKIFLNLAGEAKMRLEKSGVENIEVKDICTYCNADKFFSARHAKLWPVEGMVAYIGKIKN